MRVGEEAKTRGRHCRNFPLLYMGKAGLPGARGLKSKESLDRHWPLDSNGVGMEGRERSSDRRAEGSEVIRVRQKHTSDSQNLISLQTLQFLNFPNFQFSL